MQCNGLEKQKYSEPVYRDLLKTKLITSIIAKWPPGDRATQCICIQQDGAKVHIYNDDDDFFGRTRSKRSNVEVITQLANSPGTNLLDLGFLHAVQCANDELVGGEGEMIQHIQQTFAHYLRQKSIIHSLP